MRFPLLLQRHSPIFRRHWQQAKSGPFDPLRKSFAVELALRRSKGSAAWTLRRGCRARYITAFRDNEIDRGVLPKLTSEDLREIGVTAIGHWRKLRDAITALGASATQAHRSWGFQIATNASSHITKHTARAQMLPHSPDAES
jgi:hypothetical protein